MTAPAPDGTGRPHLPMPARWQRNAVFGTIGLAIVLGWVGDAFWASLVDRSPLTLLLLNAKPRYQLLTVNQLEAWVFYPVALVRLLITKPLVWLVGAWYGPRAIRWAESRSERGGRFLRWVERHFGRFGWAIILVTSSNPVCLLAGSVGYPLLQFMLLAAVGTMVRLWAVDVVGAALTDEIDAFIGWVGDHRVAVVAASVAVVLVGLWWQRRHGGSELDELAALDDALKRDAAAGRIPEPEEGS